MDTTTTTTTTIYIIDPGTPAARELAADIAGVLVEPSNSYSARSSRYRVLEDDAGTEAKLARTPREVTFSGDLGFFYGGETGKRREREGYRLVAELVPHPGAGVLVMAKLGAQRWNFVVVGVAPKAGTWTRRELPELILYAPADSGLHGEQVTVIDKDP